MAHFIYGVIAAEQTVADGLVGLNGEPITVVVANQLAALVSDFEDDEVIPRRKTLADFQRVITSAFDAGSILPMSFGMIGSDTDEVVDILLEHEADLLEKLSLVEGSGEFVLRVGWQGNNLFAQMVERYSELRALRDEYFLGGRTPSQEEQIHLGQVFEHFLETERTQIAKDCVQALEPHLKSHSELSHRNESSLCSLALLVPKEKEAGFAAAVEQFASFFSDDHLFELAGPSAPFTFSELRIAAR